MANTNTSRVLGDIEFSGKDIPAQPARYDRLALNSRNEIMLVSLVVETQFAKAIGAILNGGAKAQIQASKGKVMQPDASYGYPQNPGRCTPTAESYTRHTQKLEFGLVHVMYVTRQPGFMPVMTHESLWRELTDVRFTTPILREWLPYIESELKSLDLLRQCESFNFPYKRKLPDGTEEIEVMRCGVLDLTTDKLDDIVKRGLQGGYISIPQKATGSKLDPAPPSEALDLDLGDRVIEITEDEEGQQWMESVSQGTVPVVVGPKSWVVACNVGESKPSYNSCYYSTKEKAEAAGADLYSRWTMLRSYEVEPSDHEPNY